MNFIQYNTTIVALFLIFMVSSLSSCNQPKKDSSKETIQTQEIQLSIEELNSELERSALEGPIEKVSELLDKGAQVNHVNENGSSALMLAAYNGNTKIVALLIKHGGMVNMLDVNRRSALIYASSGPFVETVELLLKNGADVNAVDNVENFTALMFAAAEGQTEVVKLLLEHGADKTLKDIDGDDAYKFATSNGHNETADFIKNHQ